MQFGTFDIQFNRLEINRFKFESTADGSWLKSGQYVNIFVPNSIGFKIVLMRI